MDEYYQFRRSQGRWRIWRCGMSIGAQLVVVGIVFGLGGRQTAHVRAIDVDGKPIRGACILPYYWTNVFGYPLGQPGDSSITSRDGRATLHAPVLNSFSAFDVYADGYVPWRTPKNVIFTNDPGTHIGGEIVLYLYQEPAPIALFTIPNEYRGSVLITRPKEVTPPLSIHQRVHEFIVMDPAVPTAVPEIPPLHMTWTSRIQVRYADGRLLANYPDFCRPVMKGMQVFKLEKYSEPQVLFVGEPEEFDSFCRSRRIFGSRERSRRT